MKKAEKVLVVFAIISVVLKELSVSGGSFLALISLLTLSCFYFVFSFALLNGIGFRSLFRSSSYKGLSVLRVLGAIGTGIGLSSICVGVSYKLFDFAGATESLFSGVVILAIVLIVAIIKNFKKKDGYYMGVIVRTGVMLLIGVGFMIL